MRDTPTHLTSPTWNWTVFTERELLRIMSALDFWLLKAKQGEVALNESTKQEIFALKKRVQELKESHQ